MHKGPHVANELRPKYARLLRAARDTWLSKGHKGKWARFRMAWLMERRLGQHSKLNKGA
jgi:hypothetical protein